MAARTQVCVRRLRVRGFGAHGKLGNRRKHRRRARTRRQTGPKCSCPACTVKIKQWGAWILAPVGDVRHIRHHRPQLHRRRGGGAETSPRMQHSEFDRDRLFWLTSALSSRSEPAEACGRDVSPSATWTSSRTTRQTSTKTTKTEEPCTLTRPNSRKSTGSTV